MKTIEIIVSPKGETRLETKGFAGASCQEASRFIEKALGRKTAECQTGGYHQAKADQARNRERR